MNAIFRASACLWLSASCCGAGEGPRHYVFFNRQRQRISDASFLETKAFQGAQLKYTWRELEHGKGGYDFSPIREDLAFPKSVTMQYANFMPGEWLPENDRGYLRAVYERARVLGVGVGGPDLLPFRPAQLKHSYPLLRQAAGQVPTGIAVQEGNYRDKDPKTGAQTTIAQFVEFATGELKVDYIFWCTEEPYYSRDLVPYLGGKR